MLLLQLKTLSVMARSLMQQAVILIYVVLAHKPGAANVSYL